MFRTQPSPRCAETAIPRLIASLAEFESVRSNLSTFVDEPFMQKVSRRAPKFKLIQACLKWPVVEYAPELILGCRGYIVLQKRSCASQFLKFDASYQSVHLYKAVAADRWLR